MSRLSAVLLPLLIAAPAGALEVETLMAPTGVSSTGAPLPLVALEVTKGSAFVRYSTAPASWYPATLLPAESVAQGLTRLRALPGVADAQPNRVYRANRSPSDPLTGSQYALSQMNTAAAWDYEVGTSSLVTVAVMDSGVLSTHPDLTAKFVTLAANRYFDPGASGAASVDNPPAQACQHGTHVAGIAAASTDNGNQIAGVSWGARLLSLRVFDTAGCPVSCSGCGTNDAAIGNALAYAATLQNTPTHGKIVVNISLGGCGGCSAPLQSSVTAAVNAGVVIIAAAGNSNCSGQVVEAPGNCSGIIPVGATNSSGDIATFSSRGPELASGGVAAPGVNVLTTDLGNGTVTNTGTSFAAPNVAGVAALLIAAKPNFTGSNITSYVRSTLRTSADAVGLGTAAEGFKTAGNSSGAGRVNAFLAMRLAITGQLADFQGEDKVVAFPNPFRADRHQNVTFAFPPSLQGSTDVTIKIYTMDGALVRDLRSATWNLKNEHGRNVASGTYLFAVSTSQGKKTGRISVIR